MSATLNSEQALPMQRDRSRFATLAERMRWRLMRLTDRVILSLVPTGRARNEVLIVRLDAIGDFILWLDAAKAFRSLFPGARLVLAANVLWADLATRLDLVDEVWPIDVPSFSRPSRYRAGILWRARRRGFGQAVQPAFSRWQLVGDRLVEATGAARRIGSSGDLTNMTGPGRRQADRGYTRLLPAAPAPLTEMQRNAEFVTLLGGRAFEATVATIPRLGDLSSALIVDGPYLVVFPGASAVFRQWPAARFAAAANRLASDAGMTVVLCGANAERSLCASIASELAVPHVDLAGRTSLWELVEVVRGARLLIGNETSAVHIAAAVGTPSVCIVGGGHYGRFVPYGDVGDKHRSPTVAVRPMTCFGCNWTCTQPHRPGEAVPCISAISAETVIDRANGAMRAAARTTTPPPFRQAQGGCHG